MADAHLNLTVIGDGSLIGIKSVILHGAVIGKHCLITLAEATGNPPFLTPMHSARR